MSTSRFDININQPYQSVRIPLPLDYLAGIAKNMQDDYDKGLHTTDPFSKIASVIEAAPMYADEKKKYIDSFNKEREDLYNSTKSYSDPNFQRKANELVTKYANDPRLDQFKATNQAFKDYQTQKKDAKNARNLDFTYELQPDGSYKQITLNQGVYSPKFTEYEDYNKTAKEVMGKIAESGYNRENDFDFSKVKTANNGETQVYSRTKEGWVGVSDPKVQKLSKLMVEEYGNTNAGKHHLQSLLKPALGNAAYNLDYKGLSDAAQYGDTTALQYKQAIDQEFANHLYAANANQIGGKSTESIDYHFEKDKAAAQANDDKKFIESLTPSTVEGRTFDATQGDSNMKGLLDTGVFKNTNGVITFDQNALLKPPSTFDVKMSDGSVKNVNSYQEALDIYHNTKGASITPNDKVRTIKTNQTEFNNQLIKMSNAVGIDPKSLSKDGKIDPTAISKLATSYNYLTKSRSLDLNLSPAIQNSESESANLNWYNVKQVDPNDPTTTIKNTPLGENEKVVVVNRRTDNSGKVYNEGYIENTKTKEVKPVSFRSQSVEKNLVFDALGKIQKVSIDNLSQAPNKNPVMTKPINTQYGTTSMEVIGKEDIGQGYYIQALTDPHNKYNTLYTIRNSNNEIVDMKQSLGDLKKSVETFYFTQIPEGRTELENLKTNTKQAENQQAQ